MLNLAEISSAAEGLGCSDLTVPATESFDLLALLPKESNDLSDLGSGPALVLGSQILVVMFEEGDIVALGVLLADWLCLLKHLEGRRFSETAVMLLRASDIRALTRSSSYVRVNPSRGELGGLGSFCGLFGSIASLLACQIGLHEGFRRGDILVSEIVLLLIGLLEVILGRGVEGIPLLDDLADDLRLSQLGELGFVLVVLLSGELTVNLSHKLAFSLLGHSDQRIIII